MAFNIGFWKKESQNLLSHGKGLNEEQVEALKALKPGDRLIIWKNDKKSDQSPDYSLKVFAAKANKSDF